MKILLVHNYYLQPGGEDQVFAAETEILRTHGEDVRVYTIHNNRLESMTRVDMARATIWNAQAFRELTTLLRDDRPDLMHCHNTFPLISPAAYGAARNLRIPVIQTLHNFRLLCLNGLFLRSGRRCEDCLGRPVAWPGVLHRCYRQSRPASAVVAAMLGVHKVRHTWQRDVDTYVAVSEFARAKFIAGGLPADRIVVKPNFLPRDPGIGAHAGGVALYVGRLSAEKGIITLLELWTRLVPNVTLRIIGSGPLETLAAESPPNVEWLGWQPHQRVVAAMKDASFLVFPTECYEGFPMVLLEAMATGLPVIASDQGSLADIVQDGRTGILVPAGNQERWAQAVTWAINFPDALASMGQQARRAFESHYTPEIGYERLSEVYHQTLTRAATSSGSGER